MLPEQLKVFKVGGVSNTWLQRLNAKKGTTLSQAIANVHWLTLLGTQAEKSISVIESN